MCNGKGIWHCGTLEHCLRLGPTLEPQFPLWDVPCKKHNYNDNRKYKREEIEIRKKEENIEEWWENNEDETNEK